MRVLLTLLLVLSCWRATAHAQPVERAAQGHLTSRGRIMASGELGGFWSNDSPTLYGSYVTWTLHADPSVAYFVREDLGVGLSVGGGWSAGDLYPEGKFKDRLLAVGVILRWNVHLSERWSLMLRPLLGYAHQWSDTRVRSALFVLNDLGPIPEFPVVHIRNSLHYMRLALSLPFLYALSDSVGIGIGPDLVFDHLFGIESRVRSRGLGGLASATASRNRVQLGASVSLYASF